MKRFLTLMLLALAKPAACQSNVTTFAISPDAVDRVTVQASHFESTLAGNTMLASGGVQAVILQRRPGETVAVPITINADTLAADFTKTLITAENHVAVETGGRVVRGGRVTYDWTARQGRVESVAMEIPGLSFRATSLDLLPTGVQLNGVSFGGCGLDNPDYLIRADSVKLGADRRVIARNAVVELFGHGVIRFPRLAYDARPQRGDGRRGLPIPRPGYSRVSGATLAQPIPITDELTAEVEATTRLGLRGGVFYRREGRVTPYVEMDWKQQRSARSRLSVLVSRLPEAGIRFGRRSKATLNVGYYREHTTNVSQGRANIAFDHRILNYGEHTGLRLIVGGHASTYTNGNSYASVRVEASVGRERPAADVFEEIGVRQNGIAGESPFEWDQVPLQTELFAGKRIAWGAYRLEGSIRYDLGHRDIYDVEYAIARRFKCLAPEVRYSQRKQALFLGITIQTP